MTYNKHARRRDRRKSKLIGRTLTSFLVLFVGILSSFYFFAEDEDPNETAVLCEHLKESITVSGDLGTVPVLDLKEPVVATNSCTETFITSKSEVLKPNEPVLLSVTVFDSRSGEKLSGDVPKILSDNLTSNLVETHVYEELLKTRVGERIVTYLPVKKDDRVAGELSIVDVLPLHVVTTSDITAKKFDSLDMSFTSDALTGEELPVEVKYEKGKPVFGDVKFSPEKSSSYTLIEGEGKQLSKNSSPILQYLAKDLSTNKDVESTYYTGIAKKLDLKLSYEAISLLLADEHVGSRVLLFLTDEDTDGKTPIIMVVDILASEK